MNIAILLATYNGEKYLQDQIDSLYSQTYKDWTLYVHDDGSTDDTLKILQRNSLSHDNFVVLEYDGGLGARDNFLSLFKKVEADYYFFCDQDDVWLENKVILSINKMLEWEKNFKDIPIVVYSDLRVVSQDLRPIHASYWEYAGTKPSFITTFDRLAAGNFVTGCTMLVNKKVKKVMLEPTQYAYMHDAWITACTIKAGGKTIGIDMPLVCYRQHGFNSIGASPVDRLGLRYRIIHAKEMFHDNQIHYLMLRSLGYGSVFTYIRNKILYKLYSPNHVSN